MKIWLVGKSGMLCNSFEKLLRERGIDFFVTDERQVDICDRNAVANVDGYSHVVNCAAYTNVDGAEKDAARAFSVNRDGVQNLAEAAKKKEAKLVHFSTDFVFDGTKNVPYVEEDRPNPLSVYGKSKYEGEKCVWDASENNLIIRTSWLFGDGRSNFVKTMVGLLRDEKSLNVVSDQVGSPTYSDDLALATLDLLECEGLFHYSGAGELSWYEFAQEIASSLQKSNSQIQPILADFYESLAPRPAYSVLSTKKALKYTVVRNWKKGLEDYVQRII
ncbi:MAG: dTDP-4-dehydrorhamnose reductase [Chlamydiales bacterium]